MTIERETEQAIVAAVVEAVGDDRCHVSGVWAPTRELLRDDVADAAVVVRVAPLTFVTYGWGDVSLSVDITLTVRVDVDADGVSDRLDAYAEKVSAVLRAWNLATSAEGLASLATSRFAPGGISVTSSSGPVLDRSTCTSSAMWTIDLRGMIRDNNNN